MSRARNILLVEDNPDDVELTLRALQRNHIGNEVVVAPTARKRSTTVRPGEYAGAIRERGRADPARPQAAEGDGLDVLRQIRADERTRRLPVVVLTSSNEDRDIVTSYDLGANSFVRKPVDFAQFMDAVRQLGVYWLVLNELPDASTR